MADPPRVNFLIVGAEKGGTTALFDYLGDYPDVALADEKELHFFDDETRNWAAPDYGQYHARFPAPDGRPCAEATPIYSERVGALGFEGHGRDAMVVAEARDPGAHGAVAEDGGLQGVGGALAVGDRFRTARPPAKGGQDVADGLDAG